MFNSVSIAARSAFSAPPRAQSFVAVCAAGVELGKRAGDLKGRGSKLGRLKGTLRSPWCEKPPGRTAGTTEERSPATPWKSAAPSTSDSSAAATSARHGTTAAVRNPVRPLTVPFAFSRAAASLSILHLLWSRVSIRGLMGAGTPDIIKSPQLGEAPTLRLFSSAANRRTSHTRTGTITHALHGRLLSWASERARNDAAPRAPVERQLLTESLDTGCPRRPSTPHSARRPWSGHDQRLPGHV
jgi:hypothetical protein